VLKWQYNQSDPHDPVRLWSKILIWLSWSPDRYCGLVGVETQALFATEGDQPSRGMIRKRLDSIAVFA
jgi:hypothetical protein